MRPHLYILDGHNVRPCSEVLEWARWFETSLHERIVAVTLSGDVRVSTVFIGTDHRFLGDGPPLLFETMIFGGPRDGEMWRYSTWTEADRGHMRVVDALRRT